MTKKRYVGLDENNELHATGLEMKRTDWSELSQEVQENLLKMILINNSSEKELNEYIANVKKNIKEFPIEKFIFEKIIDCRKDVKAKTRIVKAWESFGYKVEESEYEDKGKMKKQYRCVAPRGEVLMGIRWIYDNKGNPIGIPEDEPAISFHNRIGFDWYINNQVVPIAERVFTSISYRLGDYQKDLFGEVIYI